ncbi:hypothetical protein AB1484_30460 [Parafrankia sp. FMc6]|uniref:hypothetical protein n=1 Tax=Parafrankia soli TaxID=2599596 RepID=UPI0034D40358
MRAEGGRLRRAWGRVARAVAAEWEAIGVTGAFLAAGWWVGPPDSPSGPAPGPPPPAAGPGDIHGDIHDGTHGRWPFTGGFSAD